MWPGRKMTNPYSQNAPSKGCKLLIERAFVSPKKTQYVNYATLSWATSTVCRFVFFLSRPTSYVIAHSTARWFTHQLKVSIWKQSAFAMIEMRVVHLFPRHRIVIICSRLAAIYCGCWPIENNFMPAGLCCGSRYNSFALHVFSALSCFFLSCGVV